MKAFQKRGKKKKALTLIELLIVIALLITCTFIFTFRGRGVLSHYQTHSLMEAFGADCALARDLALAYRKDVFLSLRSKEGGYTYVLSSREAMPPFHTLLKKKHSLPSATMFLNGEPAADMTLYFRGSGIVEPSGILSFAFLETDKNGEGVFSFILSPSSPFTPVLTPQFSSVLSDAPASS